MSRLRVGILSFAHSHARFWAEAFGEDPRVELALVWDDDRERGTAAARRFAVPYVADLDAALAGVDAVAVTSETVRHRPLIERAAARGRHVLCEKPLAASTADADAIAMAVRGAGVLFMQSFPKRLDPINHELLSLVRGGTLGRVALARVRHGHGHGLDPAFARGWWATPALSGGGALLDEGIHAADLLRWLFGDPETVQATLSAAALGLAVEDTAVAVFGWPDGMVGEVVASWTFRHALSSIELYGTSGTAILDGVDLASRDLAGAGPHLKVATGDASVWACSTTVPGFARGRFHHAVATAFVDGLTRGSAPPSGLAEGRGALAMIAAAYEAARSGRRVGLAAAAS